MHQSGKLKVTNMLAKRLNVDIVINFILFMTLSFSQYGVH